MARISPLMVVPPVVFAALATAFLLGMQREDPDALPSAIAGRAAPPVALTQLGTLPGFDDATLRDGGVKLVNYWASWCAPCRVEHPHLEALADEGVAIYGINYKDQPDKALAFLAELGNPYVAVGADETGRTAIDWGLYGVPETFILSGDGTVILRFAGPITERVLDSQIRPALAEAAAHPGTTEASTAEASRTEASRTEASRTEASRTEASTAQSTATETAADPARAN